MKIILLTDVKKHGKKGEIIEVADGYGNFLIKARQAVLASQTGVNRLNEEKAMQKKALDDLIKKCNKEKNKLEKEELIFKVKTGENDRVFGSVSVKQIASLLEEKGYSIDKKQIKLLTPLSSLGYHNIDIELHKSVVAHLKIQLVK